MDRRLDKVDLEILSIVQPDASRTLAQIARLVNRSRVACFRRLLRLKELGVIRRTITVLDPAAVNLTTTAIVTIKSGSSEPLERVAADLAAVSEVMDVFLVAERRELLLRVVMARAEGWHGLRSKLQLRVPHAEISVSIVRCLQSKTALPLDFATFAAEGRG